MNTYCRIYLSIYIILPVILSLPYIVSAQTSAKEKILAMPDSRAKVDSILRYAENKRGDTSRNILYTEALRVIQKIKYTDAAPQLYNSYGTFKRDVSKYIEAIQLHKTALELSKKQKDISEEIKALNNLGVAYRRVDEYDSALNHSMKALKLAGEIHHDYSTTIALNNIGNIHLVQGNYRDAINYFSKTIPLDQKTKNYRGIAINLQNTGECYEKLGILDSAKLSYVKALKYNEIRNDDKGIAICYNSLGNLLKEEERFAEALVLFNKALAINLKLGDRIFIASSYNNIGNAYFLEKEYTKARQNFLLAVNTAKEIGSKLETKNAYEGLMKTAEAKSNWKDALEYSNLFRIYNDSIVNESSSQYLIRMEAIYDRQREQDRIALLEASIATNKKNDRIIIIGSLILFSLLLITGILYYLRNRLLERNRILQRELEIRSQIASDLHDDMGSSLSSIHIFSELLRKSEGRNTNDLLTKIEANAKDTLEALDDIIWLVKPSNDKFSNLSVHIREFAVPLFESKNIKFDIDFPECISELSIPMETRRNIFLIIKESVNNLVKYSQCTYAAIKATYDGNDMCFTVKDNGKGFDPAMLTNRNGLKNIKSRAAQINADITISSAQNIGTEIKLLIKAKELAMPNE